MILPDPLQAALIDHFGAAPSELRALDGGDVNAVVVCCIGDLRCVLKWNNSPPPVPPAWPDPFAAEAHGLALLRQAGALRVPAVYHRAVAQDGTPSFIVLEWIERGSGGDRSRAGAALGYGLAEQHRHSAAMYGLDQHNYCGATPQPNPWTASWIEFYGAQRLGAQARLAAQRGLMPTQRRQRLAQVIDHLDTWIDERAVKPALLHGDLWSGNWLIDAANTPVLIDPAAYFGDREADLAMCRLFGGFPPTFYTAYDEAWPPAPGRDDRVQLYQLYHLLNHLNLYGEAYAAQVDQVLGRYVG